MITYSATLDVPTDTATLLTDLLIALFREELDSYEDVATRCAMPIGSIGPTRARGLSRLRREITDRGLGPADR